jgi:hypothetical protein
MHVKMNTQLIDLHLNCKLVETSLDEIRNEGIRRVNAHQAIRTSSDPP